MEDMKNLTYQEAVSIYIDRYWNRIIGNEIKNQSVALLIYDGAVNQGRGAMRSIVGESMRGLGSYIDNSEVFTKFFKNKPSFNLAIVFIVLIVVLSILIYRL